MRIDLFKSSLKYTEEFENRTFAAVLQQGRATMPATDSPPNAKYWPDVREIAREATYGAPATASDASVVLGCGKRLAFAAP